MKSKKPTYVIANTKYRFSNPKFKDIFDNRRKSSINPKTSKRYTADDYSELLGAESHLSGASIKQYCKPFTSGSAPSSKDIIYSLANALQCEAFDFLDVCEVKKEDKILMPDYTAEDKVYIIGIYNKIISSINILADVKTSGFAKNKPNEKNIFEKGDELIDELTVFSHLNTLNVADGIVNKVDKIITEIIDYTLMTPGWLPYRWEALSNEYVTELAIAINEGLPNNFSVDSSLKEIKKQPLYPYIKGKYPDIDEEYDLVYFFSEKILKHLYLIELADLIRQVFLMDFEDAFCEY